MANKIVSVSMIKNEQDIIESFVRHTCNFVDKMLICDHLSTDNTRQILESLKAENLPIEIFEFHYIGKSQEFVTNRLINIAINHEHADIVIPLDADEFLIIPNGNYEQIRNFLQTLDPNKIYSLRYPYFFLQDPKSDKNKFILQRPSVMTTKNKFHVKKIILGSNVFKKNQLHISQGNHLAITKEHTIYASEAIKQIIYAHYADRSVEQKLQKYVQGLLSTIIVNSKYSNLDYHNRLFLLDYLNGKDLTYDIPDDVVPVDFLSQYNVKLKFPAEVADLFRNLFFMAQNFATEYNYQITSTNECVYNFFIFIDENNLTDFQKTFQSCYNQSHANRKIFCVCNQVTDELKKLTRQIIDTNLNIDSVQSAFVMMLTKNRVIEMIDKMDSSEYIQFVASGDILDFDSAKNAITALTYNNHKNENNMLVAIFDYISTNSPDNFFYVDYVRDGAVVMNSNEFFTKYLTTEKNLDGGVSRTVFKKSALRNLQWIDNWLQGDPDSRQVLFYLYLSQVTHSICFIGSKSVKVHKNRVTDISYKNYFAQVRQQLKIN